MHGAAPHNLPSPPAGEGARLSEPLGEPSLSGRGGSPTHEEFLARAKWMRANPTEAEKRLWSMLRNKRFTGFKFKRQVVIDWYIADFVNFDKRVIVEADGSQHAESAYDERRDAHLQSQAFTVLRFWNNDILRNVEGIPQAIWNALQNPSPLAGEGGAKRRERGCAASAVQKTQSQSRAQAVEESLGSPTRAAPHPSAAARLPPSPARGEGLESASNV
jgi:very-short-patch-repair endonuclease